MRNRVRLTVTIWLALTTVAVMGASALGAAEPRNSEQVVFSGGGTGTFGGNPTPFGFWIWCEADSTNPYTGTCQGAMYFYVLGLVKSVKGAVVEPEENSYMMVVTTSDQTVFCSLQNVPPIVHGPVNTVNVNCQAPAGNGVSNSAVVNVTGPHED